VSSLLKDWRQYRSRPTDAVDHIPMGRIQIGPGSHGFHLKEGAEAVEGQEGNGDG